MKKKKHMCLDTIVVDPENDTKEWIINVSIIDTHKSLLMLFNIHHQPSQSICHFWEKHTTIPGMWVLLNTNKIPYSFDSYCK